MKPAIGTAAGVFGELGGQVLGAAGQARDGSESERDAEPGGHPAGVNGFYSRHSTLSLEAGWWQFRRPRSRVASFAAARRPCSAK